MKENNRLLNNYSSEVLPNLYTPTNTHTSMLAYTCVHACMSIWTSTKPKGRGGVAVGTIINISTYLTRHNCLDSSSQMINLYIG